MGELSHVSKEKRTEKPFIVATFRLHNETKVKLFLLCSNMSGFHELLTLYCLEMVALYKCCIVAFLLNRYVGNNADTLKKLLVYFQPQCIRYTGAINGQRYWGSHCCSAEFTYKKTHLISTRSLGQRRP